MIKRALMLLITMIVILEWGMVSHAETINGINVISREFHVEGAGYVYWNGIYYAENEWDITSDQPLYYSLNVDWVDEFDNPINGCYQITTNAFGEDLWIGVETFEYDEVGGLANGSAEATLQFQTWCDGTVMIFAEGIMEPGLASLFDETISQLVFQEDSLGGQFPTYSAIVNLYSSHIYTMKAQSTATASGNNFIFGISNFTPIPEPATILLLSSCLVGLAGLRRKFRR